MTSHERPVNRSPAELRQLLADLRWIRHGGSIEGVTLGTQYDVAIVGRHNFDMDKIDVDIAKYEALLTTTAKPDGGPDV